MAWKKVHNTGDKCLEVGMKYANVHENTYTKFTYILACHSYFLMLANADKYMVDSILTRVNLFLLYIV